MATQKHLLCLSLGSTASPSGLVVAAPRTDHVHVEGQRGRSENFFDVTWLERFPAGRPVPAIVARVCDIMADKRLAKDCTLLVDITSTGATPIRAFEDRAIYPNAFDLVASAQDIGPGVGQAKAPLRDVIGAAQLVLQTGRLKIAGELSLAKTLVNDLTAFDPAEPIRAAKNSDLTLALALCLWWGDQRTWTRNPAMDMSADELARKYNLHRASYA